MDTLSLRKVLELEAKKGYADTAVVGGLDRFLARWSGDVSGIIPDSGVGSRPTVGLRNLQLALSGPAYASLPAERRREFVAAILDLLTAFEGRNSGDGLFETRPGLHVPPAEISKSTGARSRRAEIAAIQRQRVPIPGGKGAPPGRGPAPLVSLDSPITVIKGINSNLATKFGRLGVKRIRDLLYFFPRRHLDFSQRKPISQLAEGKEETIVANVWQARVMNIGVRRSTEAIVGDETGNVRVVWFNNPYVAKSLRTNARIVISGRVALFRGQYVFESPEWEVDEGETIHTARVVPMYHLTQGLGPRQTRRILKSVVDQWAGLLPDFVPGETRERQKLIDLPEAIVQAHFPDDLTQKDQARVRLAFDELFLLQIGVLSKKRDWQEGQPGTPITADRQVLDHFIKSLPFQLTPPQNKSLKEIMADLAKPKPMARLLQGDVGSGKTVVATSALLMAAANGYQAAFMAPTEILAEQHFRTINQLLARAGPATSQEKCLCSYDGVLPRPATVALLTGEVDAATRRALRKRIEAGEVDIVIGTHALIQKEVEFRRLGLVVVDEQHRFGVSQRSALREKGTSPHILVMTATPIPRTLALTIYGDLDLSVIDQLPAGRQAIKTKWLKPEQRDSAYGFIRKQVAAGHQAFIICPLVEESESVQAKAATAEYERLSREVFPDLRVGLLHGRMSAADKDEVMHRFRACELDILVATPVVEVGIDIPNATVMLVESADRFGLSQLHQFRGRVGRGPAQSYCMLLAEDPSEIGMQRLTVIETVYDGFKLAEEDLRLRGPGEFFGTRQSGLPDLRMAKLSDVAILEAARNEATLLFKKDPRLKEPEHALLAKELARVWPESAEWS